MGDYLLIGSIEGLISLGSSRQFRRLKPERDAVSVLPVGIKALAMSRRLPGDQKYLKFLQASGPNLGQIALGADPPRAERKGTCAR